MAARLTQVLLRMISAVLHATRWAVNHLHDWLPDPPEAEAMGEGRIPESLEFSLRGDIECLMADHLDPAIGILRRAAGGRAAQKEK